METPTLKSLRIMKDLELDVLREQLVELEKRVKERNYEDDSRKLSPRVGSCVKRKKIERKENLQGVLNYITSFPGSTRITIKHALNLSESVSEYLGLLKSRGVIREESKGKNNTYYPVLNS